MGRSFGRVSYINSIPLFCADSPFSIVEDVPSRLNAAVAHGGLDISLISRWEYPRVEKDYAPLPEYCIGGGGEIMSVKIFSRVPAESLGSGSIFITSQTGTSSRAFRYLLEKKYGYDIFKLPRMSVSAADAVLFIGNAALSFDASAYPYVYDLGEMWRAETGLEMIYAIAVIRRDIYAETARAVADYFGKSLALFASRRADVVKLAGERFFESEGVRLGADVLDKYYSRLVYKFDADKFDKIFNYVEALRPYGYL